MHVPDSRIDAVVFDLGGVLIDWNPRYLYRTLFDDEEEMEAFLRDVCTPEWIDVTDAGVSFADAVRELAERHPEHRERIEAYRARWSETLGDAIDGTVGVLKELRASGVRLYALSNWSTETFPIAEQRFPFLAVFDGILLSGVARASKPSPAIFLAFLDRFDLSAGRCVFIDDNERNVSAAAGLGFDAIRFGSPEQVRAELVRRRLLA
jgi:2-haloacid dehalogenase